MNLRINNINFNLFTAQKTQNNQKNKQASTTYTTNSITLPGFEIYRSLSFGKSKKTISPSAFLLPPNCPPDKYQTDAAISISKGHNTIVTAPTGTGKTAIAHFAVKKNFDEGKKTFYTTPLKALSNQKYNDLKKLFGNQNVGIMTGDRKENTQAPIVVMTTEIYRNIVEGDYFGKKNQLLDNLKTVVFDEFHYMGDADRGSVWEESIMYSPENVQILALSATVGNNKKISSWINAIKTNQLDLINVPPENRHVPLEYRMFSPSEKSSMNVHHQANLNMRYLTREYYNNRFSDPQIKTLNELATLMGFKASNRGRKTVIEILRDQYKLNTVPIKEVEDFLSYEFNIPREDSHSLLLKLTNKNSEKFKFKPGQVIGTTIHNKKNPMHVIKLIEKLKENDRLPAIAFVFSKKYSEELLQSAESRGKCLTTKKEQDAIQSILKKYEKEYGFFSTNLNKEALKKGYAIHSAAILPMQKQLIEELFNKKLIKVAFATETLAAGINMPARSVIMTDYQKPSGELIATGAKLDFLRPLSANEFHQMAGRAGRRGIDKIGYVYLLNDSPEKEAQFEKLINADPTPINSALKIDASLATGFYSYLNNQEDMARILSKSFSVYEAGKDGRDSKLKHLMMEFKDYTTILKEYGFIKPVPSGYSTTSKGEMVNDLKGKPQIPIINAILDGHFEKASTTDFAGLVAAIATNPANNDGQITSIHISSTKNDDELSLINSELNTILNKYLGFDRSEISATNVYDEIIDAIEIKYGHILSKNLNEINEERERLNNLIKEELQELNINYTDKQQDVVNTLKNRAEQLREEKYIIKRFERIKFLLQERLAILTKQKLSTTDNEHTKYEIYNNLRNDFVKYNERVDKLLTHIPPINLNETAFLLVNKWATLNAISSNHNENWTQVCNLLEEVGSIKYEGDLFNAIAQTISFLTQLDGMLTNAIKSNSNDIDTEKLYKLSEKCKGAIKLLKTPPLYSKEEV